MLQPASQFHQPVDWPASGSPGVFGPLTHCPDDQLAKVASWSTGQPTDSFLIRWSRSGQTCQLVNWHACCRWINFINCSNDWLDIYWIQPVGISYPLVDQFNKWVIFFVQLTSQSHVFHTRLILVCKFALEKLLSKIIKFSYL